MSDKRFISFSRLQRHSKCAQAFDYHYIQRIRRSESSEALTIGSIVHECLERYYLGEVPDPAVALTAYWNNWFKEAGIDHVREQVDSLREDIAHLYWRASEECTDRSLMIRNANGSVPKPYGLTSNKQFNTARENMGIDGRTSQVEVQVNKSGKWDTGLSFIQVYNETWTMLDDYQDISGLDEVIAVEFPFSEPREDENGQTIRKPNGELSVMNPVVMPRSQDYFLGYVDLIARINDGIAIIDHKTSSGDPPDFVSLSYHEQLLLYAWAYEQLFRERPKYIGINHLRSKRCVLVPINWDLVQAAIEKFDTQNLASRTEHVVKHAPFEYQSPCLSGAKSLADTKRPCVFLDLCYPQLHQILSEAPAGEL
jgi:hypothetical protein